MEKLIVDNIVIPYEIVKSKKAKRMRITIVKDCVKVTVPCEVKVEQAKTFVEVKKEWIVKKIAEYKVWQAQQPVNTYISGEKFLYRGSHYVLRIVEFKGKKAKVELEDKEIIIYLPYTSQTENKPMLIKEILIKWYKNMARHILKEKLDYHSKLMRLNYNQLRIKEQKTRWGSCSNKGNINLNWRIILAPDPVINYLLIHELAHLKYMNHSQEYWQFVGKFMPGYEKYRKWLKNNGRYLVV